MFMPLLSIIALRGVRCPPSGESDASGLISAISEGSIGAVGYAVRLALSSLIDLPSGPLIVPVVTALAIAAAGMVAYLKPRATVATSPQRR